MMLPAGLALALLAWWFVLRRGSIATKPLAVALDALPVLMGFALLLLAIDRPAVSGLVIAVLAAGLFLADLTKRDVLQEPVVFADRSELLEVARHPQLYLPFIAGPALIAGMAAVVLAVLAVLVWLEPPLWDRSWLAAAASVMAALAVALGAFALPGRIPGVLHRLAGFYTARLSPTRDPAADIAALGPLTCLLVHATVAADERPTRRQQAARRAMPPVAPAGPVVLVQAESFFDPARLDPGLRDILPAYERLRATAALQGQLQVPAWGANTVRTEFAVLSGLPEEALGLDCFNPYDAFATAPGPDIPSLARAMRAAGRHTVFVHPFDLKFYNRRRVLPRLGFDELIGPEAFATAPRRGSYVADEALAEVAAAVLRKHGSQVFMFIATMEAHGPWDGDGHHQVPLPQRFHGVPGETALARWLGHLQGTDQMMAALEDMLLCQAGAPGWLALYGDHQPSMPALFDAIGFTGRQTDYLVWHAGQYSPGTTLNLSADALAVRLLEAMRATVPV
jgi:hypothetical protein